MNTTLISSSSISYTTLNITTTSQDSMYTNSTTSTKSSTDGVTINETDTGTVTKTCEVCNSAMITSEPLQPTTITYRTTIDGTPKAVLATFTKCSTTTSKNDLHELSEFPSVLETSSYIQIRSGTPVISTASIVSSFEGHATTIHFKQILLIAMMLL